MRGLPNVREGILLRNETMHNPVMRRLIFLPLILVMASVVIFLLPYLTGIDPTMAVIRARVGERVLTEESIARLRTELELDRSLPVQYLQWVGRLVRGDLGFSYVSRAPVGVIILRGLRVTAQLSIISLLLAIALALPLGIWAAMRPGSQIDIFVSITSQVGVAIPQYVLAPLLIRCELAGHADKMIYGSGNSNDASFSASLGSSACTTS